jgi:dCTP deaminase
MVLTDREIQSAIQHRQIVITPTPNSVAYSSTSLDLTLGGSVRIWKPPPVKGVDQVICPAAEGYNYNEFAKDFTDLKDISGEGIILEPQMFLLGWTKEEVDLPAHSRLAARVEGKSSLARLGIGIHITAPTIHAGFSGPIQLEICNHGTLRVKLQPNMPVCQLIFEQTLGTPHKGYAGQFAHQKAE